MKTLIASFGFLMLLGAAPAFAGEKAPASSCAECNSLKDVGACCRALTGCEYWKNLATDGYACRAAGGNDLPKATCTKPEVCQKNYKTCVAGINQRKKQVESMSEAVQTAFLKNERATCQSRLEVCRRSCD